MSWYDNDYISPTSSSVKPEEWLDSLGQVDTNVLTNETSSDVVYHNVTLTVVTSSGETSPGWSPSPEQGEENVLVVDWTTMCLVFVLSVLIVVTIVGNLLVCLSVVLVRKLRKPQNYLLVSLALSDLFVAMFVMPFALVFEVHGGIWPLNNGLCDLWVSGKSRMWETVY
jgi:hypothetical protein